MGDKGAKNTAKDRDERLKQALRENLKRRKSQAKLKKAPPDDKKTPEK